MWENLGGLLRVGGLRTRPQNVSRSLAANEGQEGREEMVQVTCERGHFVWQCLPRRTFAFG